MSKSVLIIDTPESCVGCPINYWVEMPSGPDEPMCYLDLYNAEEGKVRWRDKYDVKNCPLKVLPEELITPYMFRQEMIALGLQNEDGTVSVYSEDYMEGWNDCIQALLGEEE